MKLIVINSSATIQNRSGQGMKNPVKGTNETINPIEAAAR